MFGLRSCIFLYFLHSSTGVVDDLPPYFPHCNRFNPKLSECLLNASETVRPYLAKGIPELGIGSFEPHVIPEISLSQGTQALNFKALLKNVTIRGLTSYKMTQFDFDVPNLQFFCKLNIPKLELDGDYSVTGKVLVAPIEGQGKFTAGVGNTKVTVYQKVERNLRKGVEFLRIVYTNTSMTADRPTAKLDGLFGGDARLTSITNTAINENINELFQDLKPVIEQVITKVIDERLFNFIANNVPFDKLYPPKQ